MRFGIDLELMQRWAARLGCSRPRDSPVTRPGFCLVTALSPSLRVQVTSTARDSSGSPANGASANQKLQRVPHPAEPVIVLDSEN